MFKHFLFPVLLCIGTLAQGQVPAKQDRSGFELLGRYRDLGGLMASTVAPGPTPGSERLYASYLYFENTFDVVATNPANGASEVFFITPLQVNTARATSPLAPTETSISAPCRTHILCASTACAIG